MREHVALGWNRLFSLTAYVAGTLLLGSAHGLQAAVLFAMSQVVVLLFIWFADFFGDWIGAPPFGGGNGAKVIDRESPGWLVAGFGWMILIGVFTVSYFYA